jgi:hypothetical protein
MQAVDGSAVEQVANLRPGAAFSRSLFFPLGTANAERIATARKSLMSYLSPVVARAKERRPRNYRVITSVSHTKDYDIVVTGIILAPKSREDDPI